MQCQSAFADESDVSQSSSLTILWLFGYEPYDWLLSSGLCVGVHLGRLPRYGIYEVCVVQSAAADA